MRKHLDSGDLLALLDAGGAARDHLAVDVVRGRAGQLNVVVGKLAELSIVQTKLLLLGGHAQAQAGHEVHEEENQAGHDKGVAETRDTVGQLVAELDPVVVEPATVDLGEAVQVGNVVSSEEGGQDVTGHTANGVLGKDIQTVVNAKDKLELGGKVAHDSTDDTVDDSSPGGDETRGRGDGNEAGNGTRAEADSGPLLLQAVVEQAPGDTGDGGSQVGDQAGHDGAQVSSQGGTTVEAEPADPEEDGSEHDVGDVVGAVGQALGLVVAGALAEHERVGEGGGTGRDVDGGTTGKVETAELEGPAVGVPGPVGDGVVDDGGPDEDEDDAGQHATAVSSSTNGQSGGNGGEHALVQAEEQIGDLGAADGGLREGLDQRKVGQITNEGAAGVGERQGISPEEPLEADDCYAHHGEPDERECRLATGQARVEEADTGDHEQDQGGRGHDPGEVAAGVVDVEVGGQRVAAGVSDTGSAVVDLERTGRHVGGC